jgi:uncharacterized membrane protein
MSWIYPALLLLSAVSSGLVAGIFYAFSSFVIGALDHLPDGQAINAMNEINVTVYASSFMILFMGAALLCVLLAVWALLSIRSLDSQLVLAACILYLAGCFGVTIIFNVPLNDQLAAADAGTGDALWPKFLRDWTMWNTIRTVGAGLSAVLFILALLRGYGLGKAIA